MQHCFYIVWAHTIDEIAQPENRLSKKYQPGTWLQYNKKQHIWFSGYAVSICYYMGHGFRMVGAGLPNAGAIGCLVIVQTANQSQQSFPLRLVCHTGIGGIHYFTAAACTIDQNGKL